MFRARIVVAVPIFLTVTAACSAQSANSASAACNLEDGRQVRINYTPVTAKSDKVTNGKPWSPGGAPMTLFTEAPLTFAGSTIPIGAYSVYPIPGKDKWALAVNKNVTPGSPYDEKQDLVRAPMEIGGVNAPPKRLQASFAHVAPKQCSIRLYYETTGAFVEFNEK